jgi:ABC-2 type transport system permease protein
MLAEFVYHLRRLRGRIIGWSIGLALYGLMMAFLYDDVRNIFAMEDLLAAYPPELMAFFGGVQALNTPAGFLDTYYFSYMTMIAGIFAIGAATGMLVGDEERGVLDLVLAHPISRSGLFLARLLAVVVALVLVMLAGWLSWLPAISQGMELSALDLLLPFLPLLAALLFFAMLALLLSLLLPSSRLAAMLAAAAVVGNFLLSGMVRLNEDLQPIYDWTPLRYYQGGQAVNGLEWSWLLGLLGSGLLFGLLAWLLFQRRDIRVGGERSWRLPRPWQRRSLATEGE